MESVVVVVEIEVKFTVCKISGEGRGGSTERVSDCVFGAFDIVIGRVEFFED